MMTTDPRDTSHDKPDRSSGNPAESPLRGISSEQRWNPAQYERFEEQRRQPFFDLLEFVEPVPDMRMIDLGSGTGSNTKHLHETLAARETLGIDSSDEMLLRSAGISAPGL